LRSDQAPCLRSAARVVVDPELLDLARQLATSFVTLVIQRAEHRDMQALEAKLDERARVGRPTPISPN